MDVNIVILSGRLTTDPFVKLSNDFNREYVWFHIANNQKVSHPLKKGEYLNESYFIRCFVFFDSIVNRAKQLKKGEYVQVHGRLSVKHIEDQNKIKQTRFSIQVHLLNRFVKETEKLKKIEED